MTPQLAPEHRLHLQRSGLSDAIITGRGYYTATTTEALERLGFAPYQQRVPALVIPLYRVDGTPAWCQIRPDTPRTTTHKDKTKVIKYEMPTGVRMVLDVHPHSQPAMAEPQQALWITEGLKKGDALASHDCCAIALLGVWNWRGSNAHGGKTALPDWHDIALNGRTVYIAFDSDMADNPQVARAAMELAAYLHYKGASPLLVHVPAAPDGGKQGVDDYLVAGGTIEALRETATPPPPDDTRLSDVDDTDAPLELARAVLTFTDLLQRTLPARQYWLPWLPERGIAMVYGKRGVGKTMFALDAALSLVTGTPLLGWDSTPAEVLYIDGEMAMESIRDRLVHLAGSRQPHGLHLLASEEFYAQFERDLRLTDVVARTELDRFLDQHPAIRVLFLDNISTLFAGMSEDKKQDWEPVNAWLIRLRHRGISPVLLHHAGKSGQQRGTSGREDILDTVIALREPPDYDPTQGCRFHLEFTKSRGVAGDVVQSLDACLVNQDVDGTAMLTWDVKPLEASQRDKVLTLLKDGENNTRLIAEDVGCSASYVRRIKRAWERGDAEAPCCLHQRNSPLCDRSAGM